MPPTFVYLLMLLVWVFFACLVWLIAGFMLLTKRTRAFARPICFAMAGTFPFVFAFQTVAAPLVAVLLFVIWAFQKLVEPGASGTTENGLVIVVSIGAVLLSAGIVLGASLAGFYEGWRAGWAFAKGSRPKDILYEGPTGRFIVYL